MIKVKIKLKAKVCIVGLYRGRYLIIYEEVLLGGKSGVLQPISTTSVSPGRSG